jgi:cholest-4-en-3-one 26-monooxygenase
MSLTEIDLANPDHFVEAVPHHWFKRLRAGAPVYWHPEQDGPGFWCITKYEDLKHVSKNPQLFSSELGGTNIDTPPEEVLQRVRAIMLNMDPPQHVKFRRIVQRGFTPRMVAKLESRIRQLATRIVDRVAHKGECEFVEELAAELPLQVICELMGVPLEDRHHLFELTNRLIGFDDPEFSTSQEDGAMASAEVFAYANQLARLRKEKPTDDLTSSLLQGEVDGERLNELEFCSFFLLLLVAGNETTRTVTTHGMHLLIQHPAQLQELVDHPSLVPSAVEEILRYAPAVNCFRRTATADTEIRGQRIKAGDKVTLWYPSANRDEEVFEDADRFDIHRRPNDHLAFGIGEHFCLGANLARCELRIIFEEMVRRLRNPQLAGPVRRLRSNFINGVKEMRIKFTPERARL